MHCRKTKSGACMLIAVALLAYSVPGYPMGILNTAASAAPLAKNQKSATSKTLTGIDFLAVGVDIYEKLAGALMETPEPMGTEKREGILKAMRLGLVTLEDLKHYDAKVTKQTAFEILYRVILAFDESFAVSEEEADRILNGCLDNAYVFEDNRCAYAFMIKHGVVADPVKTDPNKLITKESAEILAQRMIQLFAGNIYVGIGSAEVCIGDSVQALFEKLGKPGRIDESGYGFLWYIYNASPADFIMVGVTGGRVCSFYTNAKNFNFGGITSGTDPIQTSVYEGVDGLCFGLNRDALVDSVSYIPFSFSQEHLSNAYFGQLGLQVLDIVNAARAKEGKLSLVAQMPDPEMPVPLNALPVSAEQDTDETVVSFLADGATAVELYETLMQMEAGDALFGTDGLTTEAVTITSQKTEDGIVRSEISIQETQAPMIRRPADTVTPKQEDYSVTRPEFVVVPYVDNITDGQVLPQGQDVSVHLSGIASDRYRIKIYDFEKDDYLVNQYVTTNETEFTFPSYLFTPGGQYRLCVEAVDGEYLYPDRALTFTYGKAETGVKILTPADNGFSYESQVGMSLASSVYHDFKVKIYQDKKLIREQVYRYVNYIVLPELKPGKYTVEVLALSRNTDTAMASDQITFQIRQPETTVTETILEEGETYPYVYGNAYSPFVYFYSESWVDGTKWVPIYHEDGTPVYDENGEQVCQMQAVKKKKITQTRVTATAKTRARAGISVKNVRTTGYYEPMEISGKGTQIAAAALSYQGVPYLWGGTTPSGFDCSGLVQYVCAGLGIKVSRTSREQFANDGVFVDRSELTPGDLLYFQQDGVIHHVGIYIGDGKMVHAPRTGDVVRVADINTHYYLKGYVGAKRLY